MADTSSGDGDGDTTSESDGDGDGDTMGDGDGDTSGDGDGDAAGDGDGDAAGDGDGDGDGGTGGDDGVPTNAAALLPWLEAESYATFPAESAIHDATGSSPHGPVRVFINDALDTSLANNEASHPVGAAAIKEIYANDQTTLRGWAVAVKTQADSAGGDGWYWYEILDGGVVADANGDGICVGCHEATGQDFFSTDYPLQ